MLIEYFLMMVIAHVFISSVMSFHYFSKDTVKLYHPRLVNQFTLMLLGLFSIGIFVSFIFFYDFELTGSFPIFLILPFFLVEYLKMNDFCRFYTSQKETERRILRYMRRIGIRKINRHTLHVYDKGLEQFIPLRTHHNLNLRKRDFQKFEKI